MKVMFDECIDEMEDLDNVRSFLSSSRRFKLTFFSQPTMGHQCSGLFNAVPNVRSRRPSVASRADLVHSQKRDYPDYYAIITQPIVRFLRFSLQDPVLILHTANRASRRSRRKSTTDCTRTLPSSAPTFTSC